MGNRRRTVGAILTLAGFLGTSALAAVSTLHVRFEHGAHTDPATHAHHATSESHSHPHRPAPTVPRQSHPDSDGLHHGDAPGHEHVLMLAAELQARPGRARVGQVSGSFANVSESHAPIVAALPHRPPARASPDAPAAPRSRRSVVLQV